jgi:hypothetical protein
MKKLQVVEDEEFQNLMSFGEMLKAPRFQNG